MTEKEAVYITEEEAFDYAMEYSFENLYKRYKEILDTGKYVIVEFSNFGANPTILNVIKKEDDLEIIREKHASVIRQIEKKHNINLGAEVAKG